MTCNNQCISMIVYTVIEQLRNVLDIVMFIPFFGKEMGANSVNSRGHALREA